MPPGNIIPVADLIALRERLSGQTIVLATGCFDILHVGHLYFVKDASTQGDILVVGVNSDRSVKMIKGLHRPIVGQDERAELIAAFRYVDYVFIYDDTVADDCIIRLRPHVFAIGEESMNIYPSEITTANVVDARIYVVTRIPSVSTTLILTNIQKTLED